MSCPGLVIYLIVGKRLHTSGKGRTLFGQLCGAVWEGPFNANVTNGIAPRRWINPIQTSTCLRSSARRSDPTTGSSISTSSSGSTLPPAYLLLFFFFYFADPCRFW